MSYRIYMTECSSHKNIYTVSRNVLHCPVPFGLRIPNTMPLYCRPSA